MSSLEFGWESLLDTDAPQGCSLKAALFTTYDGADERLLVEHLLPLLLKLGHESESEGKERQYFLLELDRRLKELHDRLVVVSSTVREEDAEPHEGDSSTYGWIWRSIRHLTVGSQRKAVQHAKLWLLHWGAADAGGSEFLEVVVSSANLTMSAFKGQVQAAWRACVELEPRKADARLRTWGILPDFLGALADSARAADGFTPFLELLARAECPGGVSFVASVPGTHSRQDLRRTPWGAAGLGTIAPRGKATVTASILSPYVGSWTEDALRRWCTHFGGSPANVQLVWIDKDHPWARAKRWLLPKTTLTALTKSKATLLHLRFAADDPDDTDLMHEEHRAADDRWSHAKVYALRRGTSLRLLVTSANFSTSAWGSEGGDGELTIENFELGVCLDRASWRFGDLAPFANTKDAATVADAPGRSSSAISWAQAAWDGRHVKVECRCEAKSDLSGRIVAGKESTHASAWTVAADGRLRKATVPWATTKGVPAVACLTCGDETVTVPIFDARPSDDRETSVPYEVEENAAEAMRDLLLFEQYGGRIAPDDDGHEDDSDDGEATNADGADVRTGRDDDHDQVETGRPESYGVPAFVDARRHLGVVDNWAGRVKRVSRPETDELERHCLRRDGERLIAAFERQAARDNGGGSGSARGAHLAAEELTLRMKHFPEE